VIEISDLIVDYDADTGARRPVQKAHVLEVLREHGHRWAERIARTFPEKDGILDPDHADAVLLRSHLELQRLHEEFLMGGRVAEVLRPLLDALRARGVKPLRVVDLGCGLGFVLRWLSRHGQLGPDVELIGADYNAAFMRAARALATRESLPCRFVNKNAFALDQPATIFTSTGVLHHFRDQSLTQVFRQQAARGARAFVHFDIRPSAIAPIGSWIFHQARMREPLAQHDGYLSALRAHPGQVLLEAVRDGAPAMRRTLLDASVGLWRIARIMQAVVAVEPELEEGFVRALGRQARRLSPWEGG
jgi:SAM-dependent methyltransferase